MPLRRATLDRSIHASRSMKEEHRALQELRRLCLSLPECREVRLWRHPNFRAGKRTFIAFEWVKGRLSIAFRLNSKKINRLLRRNGFFVTPYGRGRWVSLWADGSLDWTVVERLVRQSYRVVALQRMIAALDAGGVTGRSAQKRRRKQARLRPAAPARTHGGPDGKRPDRENRDKSG